MTPVVSAERLRLATVVYGAASPKDWRQVEPGWIKLSDVDLRTKLLPVLRAEARQEVTADPEWAKRLREECKEALQVLFPLEDHEREFITGIRESGAIRPELITNDPELSARIRANPALKWRTIAKSVATDR